MGQHSIFVHHPINLAAKIPNTWKVFAAHRFRDDVDLDLAEVLAETIADMLIGFEHKGFRVVQARHDKITVRLPFTEETSFDDFKAALEQHLKEIEPKLDARTLDREARRWHLQK